MKTSKDQYIEEQEKRAALTNTLPGESIESSAIRQSPISTQKFLGLNKASITDFAKGLVSEVDAGTLDALEVLIIGKKLELLAKSIVDNVKDKAYGKSYTAKGEKLTLFSAEVEQSELGVSWDFENTKDVIWERLKQKEAEAKKAREDRETYLKIVTKVSEQYDEETAELYKINPPIKKSTLGYKITLK